MMTPKPSAGAGLDDDDGGDDGDDDDDGGDGSDSDADDVLVTIPVVELNETEPGIAGSDSTPGPGFMISVVSLFVAARLTSGRGLQSRERGLGDCQ